MAQTVATQPLANASPTLIVVPAYGEVVQPNDQAQATLMVEEQDKDKSAAASRVNQKMNQGLALLRQRIVGRQWNIGRVVAASRLEFVLHRGGEGGEDEEREEVALHALRPTAVS